MSDSQLNEAQKQVVDHQNGPLLVVAGAGTGKTRVIVERINRLLKEGVEAQKILAVTFTEKAAAEMLERILELTRHLEAELPVLTFNAYGESILKRFNTDVGLSSNFLLMGDSAKIVFLRQQLENLELDYFAPVSNPEGLLPDVADYFSKLKQHVVLPDDYIKYADEMPDADEAEQLDKKRHQELARAYSNYLRLCEEYNVIDYDDQIFRVINLLETHPNVRKELRQKYEAIMIDEFQDTNPMQSRLIDLLVNDSGNLVVVGDDDQSIYGFRGATLSNILDFNERYPKSKTVSLTENYRSTQAILDASYKLIQQNNPERLEKRLGINKRLKALVPGEAPYLKQFENLESELYWIGEDIAARLDAGESPGKIAVLCRRNVTAGQISQTLTMAGIRHIVIGEKYQLYSAQIVRILVEALRAIVDPKADISLHHTLTGPLFNISNSLLAELLSQVRRQHGILEQLILEQKGSEYESIQIAIHTIKNWREDAAEISVGRLVYKIIDESGYKDRLYKDALVNPEAALSITQLSDFFRTLKEFESIALQPTALQYLESYPVLAASGESSEDSTLEISDDRINILTIHKAKGLEWDTVYVPDCTEGSFPLRARGGGINVPEQLIKATSSAADEHIAEERRLMYVAVTRAKQNLILSYSQRHFSPTPRRPSRFITELFDSVPLNLETAQIQPNMQQFALFAPSSSTSETVSLPRSILEAGTVKLSVSQIVTFLNCPLDFYYRYILNIPEAPSAATIYGTALHSAIETINQSLFDKKPVELKTLQEQLKENWPKDGYISINHRDRSLDQALNTLGNFYNSHVIDSPRVPHLIEWPFSVTLQPENIILRGRYDVVYDDNGIEIRDYKTTMAADTPEKAKRRTTANQQLTLYALVWQELHGNLPIKLSLEFVDTGLIGEVTKTQRGIDTMRNKLNKAAEDIRSGIFNPGSDHSRCRHPQV